MKGAAKMKTLKPLWEHLPVREFIWDIDKKDYIKAPKCPNCGHTMHPDGTRYEGDKEVSNWTCPVEGCPD